MKKNFTVRTNFNEKSVQPAFRLNSLINEFIVHLPVHTYSGQSVAGWIYQLLDLGKNRKRVLMALCLVGILLSFHRTYGQNPPVGFSATKIGADWDQPVGLTFAKDGRMFVWEKAGKVWLVENDVKASAPLLDIGEEVGNWHDHGLLGFALDPNFESTGYMYLYYTVDRHYLLKFGTPDYRADSNSYFNATICRVTRYKASTVNNTLTVDTQSRKILLGESITTGVPITHLSHAGGGLIFGSDGTLLLTTGDGASYNSKDYGSAKETFYKQALTDGIIEAAQNVGSYRSQMIDALNGKILRMDPNTGDGVPSNPYYDASKPRSARSRVWVLGLRNPFRMTRRPDTGSQNPAAGNPGVLYLGDVGYNTREELNVINAPGQNFGWPIFEGFENFFSSVTLVDNQYAPNPLFNTGGCTQQFFKFTELIQEASLAANPSFPNSCNSSVQIPANIPHFLHTRPTIDWRTPAAARTGSYSGTTAKIDTMGVTSPLTGDVFSGNCSIAGVWYTGNSFPPEYRDTYFHGDYGAGWIRRFGFDGLDKPLTVNRFITFQANVVCMAVHPVSGALYYASLGTASPYPQEIKKVIYSANQPPVAIASVDKTYGSSPLTVQFTGSQSYDPEGKSLSYQWNFNDGTPVSTSANPTHIFTAPSSAPILYKITMKVTDSLGLTDTQQLNVSLNNTPPSVTITSPVNNTLYSLAQETVFSLTATVSDAEQSASQLKYGWKTILHHNNHIHEEAIDTNRVTTAVISPVGCDGETYYYTISLTVTDDAGLSSTSEVAMVPDCIPELNVTGLTAVAGYKQVTLQWNNPTQTFDEVLIIAKAGSGPRIPAGSEVSNYTADLDFTGAGTDVDGGKVVYRGKTPPQTVTNLTKDSLYFFRIFSRAGVNWSSGTEVSAKPYLQVTGIEKPADKLIKLYPNPTQQAFTVSINGYTKVPTVQLFLYNQLGQQVLEQSLAHHQDELKTTVPVSGLPGGIYLLRVQLGAEVVLRKVVVK